MHKESPPESSDGDLFCLCLCSVLFQHVEQGNDGTHCLGFLSDVGCIDIAESGAAQNAVDNVGATVGGNHAAAAIH